MDLVRNGENWKHLYLGSLWNNKPPDPLCAEVVVLPLLYCPMTWGNLPVGSSIRCAATSCRSKIYGHHLAFQIVYWNILAFWNPPIYYDFLLSYWWSWTAWWGMYHIAFQLLGDLWMLLGLLIMAFAPMVPMAAFSVAPKLLISNYQSRHCRSSGTDKPQNWSAVDLRCCQFSGVSCPWDILQHYKALDW